MTPNIDPPPDYGLAGEVKTAANVPIVNVGDTMWTRVTVTPTSVAVRCKVQSKPPTDADWSAVGDCYNAAGQNFPGGLIGFCPHYWGYNWLGNVMVRSYDPATRAYDMTEFSDNFAINTSTNYAGDTLTYDNAGNLTYDGTQAYTYDAWNRLMTVSHAYRDSSGTLQHGHAVDTMSYDAKGRRVTKAVLGTGSWDCTYHDYYSSQWQLLEERNGSNQPIRQNVWGQTYVDELIQTTASSDPTSGGTTLDKPYYALQDANWNVLGVVNASGVLTERYEYTPYGMRTCFFSPGSNDVGCFAPTLASRRLTTSSGTQQPWGVCANGHQGLIQDEDSAFDVSRNREFVPGLARWLTRDPISYGGGGLNVYEEEGSNPTDNLDAIGLGGAGSNVGSGVGNRPGQIGGPPAFGYPQGYGQCPCAGNASRQSDAAGASCCPEAIQTVTMWNYTPAGIPHTFLQLPGMTVGFYPYSPGSAMGPGTLHNDTLHPRSNGIPYKVCPATLANLMSSINSHIGGINEEYQVWSLVGGTNCTTWACGRLSDAGIISPIWSWVPFWNPWLNW